MIDPLDRSEVMTAVMRAGPMSSSRADGASRPADLRRFDRSFAETNELRTRGTDLLLEAARAVGATRFLAQSYTGWPNPARAGR